MADNEELLKPVGDHFVNGGVTSLQYADDTIVLCSPQPHFVATLKLIIYGFENMSGLKINFNKSLVILLSDSEFAAANIASSLNCTVGSFPLSYLDIT